MSITPAQGLGVLDRFSVLNTEALYHKWKIDLCKRQFSPSPEKMPIRTQDDQKFQGFLFQVQKCFIFSNRKYGSMFVKKLPALKAWYRAYIFSFLLRQNWKKGTTRNTS